MSMLQSPLNLPQVPPCTSITQDNPIQDTKSYHFVTLNPVSSQKLTVRKNTIRDCAFTAIVLYFEISFDSYPHLLHLLISS